MATLYIVACTTCGTIYAGTERHKALKTMQTATRSHNNHTLSYEYRQLRIANPITYQRNTMQPTNNN